MEARAFARIMGLLVFAGFASTQTFTILEPRNDAAYILPFGIVSANVAITYEVLNDNYSQPVCFSASRIKLEEKVLLFRNTCSTINSTGFTMQELVEGWYELQANREEDEFQKILFRVQSYETALPYLKLEQDHDLTIAGSAFTNLASVQIQYSLGPTALPLDFVKVCLKITSSLIESDLSAAYPTCFGASNKAFLIDNIATGSYRFALVLQDAPSSQLLPTSEVTGNLTVLPLMEALPKIELPESHIEAMAIDSPMSKVAEFEIPFSVVGIPSAVSQVQVCVELRLNEDVPISRPYVPQTCLGPGATTAKLSVMRAGEYTATLVLKARSLYPTDNYAPFDMTQRRVLIQARPAEEFVPTYDWKPLRGWHTIPSGIETRLPLSNTVRKEARIPEPWRLQLPMPSPCKYFLRMDVRRGTTIASIREKAASLCGTPATCFILLGDGRILEDTAPDKIGVVTVESSGYFALKKELIFASHNREECAKEPLG